MVERTCPWCGKPITVRVDPLWDGSHGYQDCYSVRVGCFDGGCPVKPMTKGHNTIYGDTIDRAIHLSFDDWDKHIDKRDNGRNPETQSLKDKVAALESQVKLYQTKLIAARGCAQCLACQKSCINKGAVIYE